MGRQSQHHPLLLLQSSVPLPLWSLGPAMLVLWWTALSWTTATLSRPAAHPVKVKLTPWLFFVLPSTDGYTHLSSSYIYIYLFIYLGGFCFYWAQRHIVRIAKTYWYSVKQDCMMWTKYKKYDRWYRFMLAVWVSVSSMYYKYQDNLFAWKWILNLCQT